MNFVLLPFLLATSLVGNNEERWAYGPEYVFNVRISMISSLKQDNGRHLGSTVLCQLKCRPNQADSLLCRLENARSSKISPREMDPNDTTPYGNATFSPFGIMKVPFQIKFDDQGIESYIVEDSERMSPVVENMYRMIANQLSIGATLNNSQTTFQQMENFTTGECPTTFDVIHDKFDDTSKGFDIVSLNDLIIEDGYSIRIVKKRDLTNCIPHKVYFFGTRYTYGIILRDSIDKLVSSVSRISISKYHFASETVNYLDIYDSDRNMVGSVLDHLSLFLDSVQPAETPLKQISNPKSISTVVSTRCEKYY